MLDPGAALIEPLLQDARRIHCRSRCLTLSCLLIGTGCALLVNSLSRIPGEEPIITMAWQCMQLRRARQYTEPPSIWPTVQPSKGQRFPSLAKLWRSMASTGRSVEVVQVAQPPPRIHPSTDSNAVRWPGTIDGPLKADPVYIDELQLRIDPSQRPRSEQKRETGEIVFWKTGKSYGFIKPAGSETDIFFHEDCMVEPGGTLYNGVRASFVREYDPLTGRDLARHVKLESAQDPDWFVNIGGSRGYLESWNSTRGFGFVQPIDGAHHLFCHLNNLMPGVYLKEGDEVMFTEKFVEENERHEAVNVYPTPGGRNLFTRMADDYGSPAEEELMDRNGWRSMAWEDGDGIFGNEGTLDDWVRPGFDRTTEWS
eukprot:gnl/TRDRNA2_/TRDRNA2_200921_c0_seq1.p1 gnl/TRDRNA2_/TRDRNA2_200921_c0~~gnl/TRDRNA2_/TRDRNA2_200921_c0_seq1.p1  ORF type:complete len:369 (+),score=31.35 gnl/TRDRNA2_/TRDRNA2_200921_c0_seq1:89-1195(+)